MRNNNKNDFTEVINLVIKAGKIALKYFNKQNTVNYHLKDDNSPVTIADEEINDFLKLKLNLLYPDIKIFSEEDPHKNQILLSEEKLFIIDPIDGTDAFIKGLDEFTINITLKVKKRLIFSIIYSPVNDVLYYADTNKLYKYLHISKNKLQKKEIIFNKEYKNLNEIKIIATRRKDELGEIKEKFKNSPFQTEYLSFSSSIKFCYLAEGKADIYFRMAKIKLWDAIAGFHIANTAGLEIKNLKKENIMDYLLTSQYLSQIQENNFRIDEFVIKSPNLFIYQDDKI